MTLITISIAVSIILTIGAISLALDEISTLDLHDRARAHWTKLRRRIQLPINRSRRQRAGDNLS
jgi:hypothetical protein